MNNNINFKGHDFEPYIDGNDGINNNEEYRCKICNCFILISGYYSDTYRIAFGLHKPYSDGKHLMDLKFDISCNEVIVKNIIE